MVPLVIAVPDLTKATVVWLVMAFCGDRYVSKPRSASSDPLRGVVNTLWAAVTTPGQAKCSKIASMMQAANCWVLRLFMLMTGFSIGRPCLVFRVAARVQWAVVGRFDEEAAVSILPALEHRITAMHVIS